MSFEPTEVLLVQTRYPVQSAVSLHSDQLHTVRDDIRVLRTHISLLDQKLARIGPCDDVCFLPGGEAGAGVRGIQHVPDGNPVVHILRDLPLQQPI